MADNTLLQQENIKLKEKVRILEAENKVLRANIDSYCKKIEVIQEALLLNHPPIEQKDEIDYLQLLQTPVREYNLPLRTRRILSNAQCYTLGDVVSHNKNYFLSQHNCGYKALFEIEDMLEKYGLRLGMGNDPIVCAYLNSKET